MSKRKSHSGTKKAKSNHEAKKNAVLKTEKKSRLPLYAGMVCVLMVVLVGVYFFMGQSQKPSVAAATDQLTFPVETFSDGKARHYEYKLGDGTQINFFALKSSDGIIRAAFDACDVCWRAGKGYYQQGDYMVCRNCGQRFASVKVNEIKGGCNPAPLDREVAEGKLLIKVNDILKGKPYFNFPAGS